LSSPNVVESPSDDESDGDSMLSSPTMIARPQSAPMFTTQAKSGAGPRNGKGGLTLTPQPTGTKSRRPNVKV
jgi:hypothetical protein